MKNYENQIYKSLETDELEALQIKWPLIWNAFLDSERKVASLEAEVAALRGELTPNENTKYAYIGEFKQDIALLDENGIENVHEVIIEWTTIKKIMATILANANHYLEKSLK